MKIHGIAKVGDGGGRVNRSVFGSCRRAEGLPRWVMVGEGNRLKWGCLVVAEGGRSLARMVTGLDKDEPCLLAPSVNSPSRRAKSVARTIAGAVVLLLLILLVKKTYVIKNALIPEFLILELRDLPHKINQTVNEVVKEAVHIALQAPLRDRFGELPKDDMKEILHQRMFESDSYKSLPEHVALYEALEASIERENRDEFLFKKDMSHQNSLQLHSPQPGKRLTLKKLLSAPLTAVCSSLEQPVEDVPIPDDVNISDSEDTDAAHLLKIKIRPDWLKPLPEEDRPKTPEPDWIIPLTDLPKVENNWVDALAKSYKDPKDNKLLSKTRDMGSFIKWFCKRISKKKLRNSDLEGPEFKVARAFHKNSISLQFQMEECHRLLTDQVDLVNPKGHRLEYLISCDTSRTVALSIPKLKAANYPDFGLEELVPSLWIESERDYNISASYGITHWWFKRKDFYITRHNSPFNLRAVRSHMRILSVISINTFKRYGYAFLREIVIRRADYNEYKISEVDFKNLHSNDFEDLCLLHLQGKLNHLPGSDKVHIYNTINLWIKNIVIKQRVGDLQLGIESYQTKLNLTEPRWDASDFLFKEDYTIVSKPRALDHMVKDFKLYQYNPGMEYRIWSKDDKRRSEEFMKVIERRLKIQRIFQRLKIFVGERLRVVDYRTLNRTE
nr:hypothetical protein [Tanacetum cinerariifolium]